MKNLSTKMLVEAGILIGLAQVLSYVKVFEGINGGSITAGSMVPILFYALRWGVGPGLLTGVVYGILQFLLGPKYSLHLLSILLDYVLPFGLLGLAGLFRKNLTWSLVGVSIGILGRFISHVLSGAILWATYAGDMNPWLYSIVYNGGYLLPEWIISLVLVGVLYKPIQQKSLGVQ